VTGLDELVLEIQPGGAGAVCALILDELPGWFGIPEANADYATAAENHPTVVATIAGVPAGVLTTIQHTRSAAEVYVMAVRPAHHREGIGAAMLGFAEQHLSIEGVRFLQVKTLADTHPDSGYAKTRSFYSACGFEPLEVFPTLWDVESTALQMIKVIDA